MRSHYAAAVFALASIVLVSVPGNEARASDGTTTTGYVFMFGLALCVGSTDRGWAANRGGRTLRRGNGSSFLVFPDRPPTTSIAGATSTFIPGEGQPTAVPGTLAATLAAAAEVATAADNGPPIS
jgi:hypothetical protein